MIGLLMILETRAGPWHAHDMIFGEKTQNKFEVEFSGVIVIL